MSAGHVAFALLILAPAALLLVRAVVKARRARGPKGKRGGGNGIVSGWFAHRRALRLKQADHQNGMLREHLRSALRIREQAERERRADARKARGKRGTTVPGEATWTAGDPWTDSPGGERTGGRNPLHPLFVRLRPESSGPWPRFPRRGNRGQPPGPQARPAGGGSPGGPSGSGSPGGPPPPLRPQAVPDPPARHVPPESPVRDGGGSRPVPPSRPAPGPGAVPSPSPVRTGSPTLEGVVVTIQPDSSEVIGLPGLEMIIEGCNSLVRQAMSGNAEAKRKGVLGIGAAGDVLGQAAGTLADRMSETGQHYGPEVTEPLKMAGSHFRVGSMEIGEVDGRLRAIIRALRELQASGVQAPHHEQMAAE
jgi:hypothetical protein